MVNNNYNYTIINLLFCIINIIYIDIRKTNSEKFTTKAPTITHSMLEVHTEYVAISKSSIFSPMLVTSLNEPPTFSSSVAKSHISTSSSKANHVASISPFVLCSKMMSTNQDQTLAGSSVFQSPLCTEADISTSLALGFSSTPIASSQEQSPTFSSTMKSPTAILPIEITAPLVALVMTIDVLH